MEGLKSTCSRYLSEDQHRGQERYVNQKYFLHGYKNLLTIVTSANVHLSLQKQKKPSFIAVLGDSKHIFCTFATLRHPNLDAKLHI